MTIENTLSASGSSDESYRLEVLKEILEAFRDSNPFMSYWEFISKVDAEILPDWKQLIVIRERNRFIIRDVEKDSDIIIEEGAPYVDQSPNGRRTAKNVYIRLKNIPAGFSRKAVLHLPGYFDGLIEKLRQAEQKLPTYNFVPIINEISFAYEVPPESPGWETLVNQKIVPFLRDPGTAAINTRIFLTLLISFAGWDSWPQQAIFRGIETAVEQGIQDILKYQDALKVEIARRLLYELAYMEPVAGSFMYLQDQVPNSHPDNAFAHLGRLKKVHNMVVKKIREALKKTGASDAAGTGLLKEMLFAAENKHYLSNYVVRFSSIQNYESIREKGLDPSFLDRRTDRFYLFDWTPLNNIPVRYDYLNQHSWFVTQKIPLRILRSEPGIREDRKAGDIDDMLGAGFNHYSAERVPPERLEVVDPLFPWIGYPLSLFKSRHEIMDFLKSRGIAVSELDSLTINEAHLSPDSCA